MTQRHFKNSPSEVLLYVNKNIIKGNVSFLSKLRFRSKDPQNVSNRDIQIL